MFDMLEKNSNGILNFNRPSGGYYIWCNLSSEISPTNLLLKCSQKGVTYTPGSVFYPEENGSAALQYSTTEGYVPLREAICKRMANLQIKASVENILMISGSQQALDLMGKAFIDEGDTIICESPTYLAAINAFKTYMPTFKGVAMDEEGMIM